MASTRWRGGTTAAAPLLLPFFFGCGREEEDNPMKPSPNRPKSASYGHFGKEITKMPLPLCLETECPQGHSGLLAVIFLNFLLLKFSSGR